MPKKKKKKPYFPNNYDAVASCPSEWFIPIPFDDFMNWKIGGYELPSSINCIIREKRMDTGEVTEYIYQTARHGRRKAQQIMSEGVSELTICTEEEVHHLPPHYVPEYDDPLA